MPPFTFHPLVQSAEPLMEAILAKGRAEAQGQQGSGDAWARSIEGVGQAFSGTLRDMLHYNMTEPDRKLKALRVEQETHEVNDDNVIRSATGAAMQQPEIAGIQDPAERSVAISDFALQHLQGSGAMTAYAKLSSQVEAARVKGLDDHLKQVKLQGEIFGQATQMLQTVPDVDPNDPTSLQRSEHAYATIVPALKKLLGTGEGQLGAKVPDDYDPDFVNRARQFGMSVKEAIDYRKQAGEAASDALKYSVTRSDLIDKLTKSTALHLATIDTPEEWAQARKSVSALGPKDVTDVVLSKFAPEFTPEAAAQAKVLAEAAKETKYKPEEVIATINGKRVVTLAGFDDATNQYYAPGDTKTPLKDVVKFNKPSDGAMPAGDKTKLIAAVKANPAIWRDLTETARTQIAGDLQDSGFKFPGKDLELTPAQRNVIERWKVEQIGKINDTYGVEPKAPAQQKKRDAAIKEINDSYARQIAGFEAPKPTPPAAAPKPGGPPKPASAAATYSTVQDAMVAAKQGNAPIDLTTQNLTVRVKGKAVKVGKVYPDGTFDPAK